ncbi:MAG TPA: hypothetical protein VMZ05_11365 [Spirochaetota bacterium]|nr:hypothetical protein [Spirochaetota bacterium]
MKKYVVIGTIILFCVTPYCLLAKNDSIDKGSVLFKIGSLFDVSYYFGGMYEGEYETTDIVVGSGTINLNAQYFIVDGLSFGGSGYYVSNKTKGNSDPSTKILLGPVISYYHAITDNIFLHGSGYFYYVEVNPYYTTVETSQIYLGISAGATCLVNDNLGFSGEVTYMLAADAESGGETITDSGGNMIGFSIGLSVFLDTGPPAWF